MQSLLCPGDDRGPDGRGRVDREPYSNPYATLDLSDEQRLEIDQIRLTMHREERRCIDAVLSAQQREQLDHERTGR